VAGSADLTGQILVLAANHMQGPAPLDCGPARLEATSYPAAGLFQGGLPAPAEHSAKTLGIGRFPVAGVRVTCDKGVFEFHQVDVDTLLLGLDNRVWTLSRAAGAQARADSPAGRVWKVCWNGTSEAPWGSTKPPPRPRPYSSPRP